MPSSMIFIWRANGASAMQGNCELCGRAGLTVTRHHLIPKARHARGETRRRFDVTEMRSRIILLCGSCHKFVHAVLSERKLAEEFNTLDKLRAQPEIAAFAAWLSKKPPGLMVRSKKRNVHRP